MSDVARAQVSQWLALNWEHFAEGVGIEIRGRSRAGGESAYVDATVLQPDLTPAAVADWIVTQASAFAAGLEGPQNFAVFVGDKQTGFWLHRPLPQSAGAATEMALEQVLRHNEKFAELAVGTHADTREVLALLKAENKELRDQVQGMLHHQIAQAKTYQELLSTKQVYDLEVRRLEFWANLKEYGITNVARPLLGVIFNMIAMKVLGRKLLEQEVTAMENLLMGTFAGMTLDEYVKHLEAIPEPARQAAFKQLYEAAQAKEQAQGESAKPNGAPEANKPPVREKKEEAHGKSS